MQSAAGIREDARASFVFLGLACFFLCTVMSASAQFYTGTVSATTAGNSGAVIPNVTASTVANRTGNGQIGKSTARQAQFSVKLLFLP